MAHLLACIGHGQRHRFGHGRGESRGGTHRNHQGNGRRQGAHNRRDTGGRRFQHQPVYVRIRQRRHPHQGYNRVEIRLGHRNPRESLLAGSIAQERYGRGNGGDVHPQTVHRPHAAQQATADAQLQRYVLHAHRQPGDAQRGAVGSGAGFTRGQRNRRPGERTVPVAGSDRPRRRRTDLQGHGVGQRRFVVGFDDHDRDDSQADGPDGEKHGIRLESRGIRRFRRQGGERRLFVHDGRGRRICRR